jgi:hypothetical protein
MTEVVTAEPGTELLALKPAPSSRFIYSNHFVPRQLTFQDGKTQAVPFYTKQRLVEVTVSNLIGADRLRELIAQVASQRFWDKNQMDASFGNYAASVQADSQSSQNTGSTSVSAINTGGSSALGPVGAQRPSVLGPQDAALVSGLLRPDIGYVFLDRTRVTPAGVAIGEHVYSLSLAPGEEVTLEQKTFSKREATFEDQTEQERQFDLELDSTYTTELEEGLDRQQSQGSTWGMNASETAGYTSPQTPYGSITASEAAGFTSSATEAHQDSTRRSVKDSQQASSKVAARYRALHKTSFKVSTEQTFEASSKRVVRNPNTTTPVTLQYFKVMQRLKLTQERYGVRLCWALSVKDPAAAFVVKLQAIRDAAIDDALRALPPEPTRPIPPSASSTSPTPTRETGVAASAVLVADKWGLTGDMSADYDTDIQIPDGFQWDSDIQGIHVTLFSKRPADTIGAGVVGIPFMVEGNKLRVRVHIGARMWIGGPGIQYQVQVNTFKENPPDQQASQDEGYNTALLSYQTALKDWQDKRDEALRVAQDLGEQRAQQMRQQLNPVNEIISQVIDREFPPSRRDEMWEIDLWQRMFEWQRAAYLAFPGWWSGGSMRDPLTDPQDFLNASWVKLYLPVRLGYELQALRWIFGKAVDTPLETEIEASFDQLIKELGAYRQQQFGAEGELAPLTTPCQPVADLFACLAEWQEYLPTDGTHLEVVQGATTAADAHTEQEIDDAAALRASLLAGAQAEAAVTEKANTLMKGNATVTVNVGTSQNGTSG